MKTDVRVSCILFPIAGAAASEAAEIERLLPLDDEPTKMGWLAARGWFAQDTHMRGSYVLTEGLSLHGQSELMMLNVPSGFTDAAISLLTRVAERVIDGLALEHGQVVELAGDGPPASLAVLEVPAGEGEGLAGGDVLRLVPLL